VVKPLLSGIFTLIGLSFIAKIVSDLFFYHYGISTIFAWLPKGTCRYGTTNAYANYVIVFYRHGKSTSDILLASFSNQMRFSSR
jgi:hypothetical protein